MSDTDKKPVPVDLDKLDRLHHKATDGAWSTHAYNQWANLAFDKYPDLAAEIRALRAQVAADEKRLAWCVDHLSNSESMLSREQRLSVMDACGGAPQTIRDGIDAAMAEDKPDA